MDCRVLFNLLDFDFGLTEKFLYNLGKCASSKSLADKDVQKRCVDQ